MHKIYLRFRGICFALYVIFFLNIPLVIYNILKHNYEEAFVFAIGLMIMFIGTYCLHRYYKRLVIAVSFDGDYTNIITNTKTYMLLSKNFVEVNDSKSCARIIFKYVDENGAKKFVFITRYTLLKEYSLDMKEILTNMKNADYIIS